MQWITIAFLVAALGLLPACSGGAGALPPVGTTVLVEGRVLEVDATPMFVDGDGRILVQSPTHGRVLILVPARERLCAASGLRAAMAIEPGARLQARGMVTAAGGVQVCAEAEHFIKGL